MKEAIVINGKTQLYGIIGNPVGHTLSPAMHNAALAALGINAVYVPMPVTDAGPAITGLRALGFRGVSVTVPHKEAVMAHVDEIDPIAERIGAVNTLLFRDEPGGRTTVIGYNTDWLSARAALAQKMELSGQRVLVVGAGGSAKAVGYGLVEAGAEVIVSNRTESTGRSLAKWLDARFVPLPALGSVAAEALVNTTSVGMEPAVEGIVVPTEILSRFAVVMDIVYAPLETRLLREAALAGCQVVHGLGMLLYQGAAQFEIWTGQKAPLEVMRAALEKELQKRITKELN